MRYYSEDHVWVELCARTATLGLSRHAAAELGKLTFVEPPRLGARIARGETLCVVESVKTAADVSSPVSGTVCATNPLLEEHPDCVNTNPETEGWICRLTEVEPADLAGLLSAECYAARIDQQTPH
jgi:glycine cleavage system H protein